MSGIAEVVGPVDEQFAGMVDELARRGFLAAGLGSAALLGLAACGGGDGSSDPSRSAGAAGFPTSVSGKFGETTVPKPPQRIVTLGLGPDPDTVLALGETPVAMAKDRDAAGGIQPWTKAKLGGRSLTLLDMTGGPPLEKIAEVKPDLIVATTLYSLEQYHDKLAKIAPVLAYAKGPNTDGWQATTTRLGKLLGRIGQAKAVIAGVEHQIAAARAAHPEFAGKTFTSSPVQADGTIYTTTDPHDLSASLNEQLGLRLSPRVQHLPASSTKGKSIVSLERIDLLDADVMSILYIAPAQRAKLEANPLFKRLGAVKRGAYIVASLPVGLAGAFPSALSIPYVLSHNVPRLAKALAHH